MPMRLSVPWAAAMLAAAIASVGLIGSDALWLLPPGRPGGHRRRPRRPVLLPPPLLAPAAAPGVEPRPHLARRPAHRTLGKPPRRRAYRRRTARVLRPLPPSARSPHS